MGCNSANVNTSSPLFITSLLSIISKINGDLVAKDSSIGAFTYIPKGSIKSNPPDAPERVRIGPFESSICFCASGETLKPSASISNFSNPILEKSSDPYNSGIKDFNSIPAFHKPLGNCIGAVLCYPNLISMDIF